MRRRNRTVRSAGSRDRRAAARKGLARRQPLPRREAGHVARYHCTCGSIRVDKCHRHGSKEVWSRGVRLRRDVAAVPRRRSAKFSCIPIRAAHTGDSQLNFFRRPWGHRLIAMRMSHRVLDFDDRHRPKFVTSVSTATPNYTDVTANPLPRDSGPIRHNCHTPPGRSSGIVLTVHIIGHGVRRECHRVQLGHSAVLAETLGIPARALVRRSSHRSRPDATSGQALPVAVSVPVSCGPGRASWASSCVPELSGPSGTVYVGGP